VGAGRSGPDVKAAFSRKMGCRTAARLAAVQVLYEIELTDVGVDWAIAQFLSGKFPQPEAEDGALIGMPAPDPDLFATIVSGVIAQRERLDGIIGTALTVNWTVPRLDILVRLILEAGVFELIFCEDIPLKVTINEYVNLANAFFDGAELGLINGVLDSVASTHEAGA